MRNIHIKFNEITLTVINRNSDTIINCIDIKSFITAFSTRIWDTLVFDCHVKAHKHQTFQCYNCIYPKVKPIVLLLR